MDDGLCGEELEWSDQGAAEGLQECLALALFFGLVGVIVGLFAEAVGADAEEPWSVGFAEEEEAEDLDECVCDGRRPEYPTPGGVLSDETACDGAEGWSEERCQTVDCDAFAALLWSEAVG